jgi:hypothetical protein
MDRTAIARNILNDLITTLGDEWDAMTDEDRLLVETCVFDATDLQLKVLAIPASDEMQHAALRQELNHVRAQLLNIKSAKSIALVDKFSAAIRAAASRLMGLAFAAI